MKHFFLKCIEINLISNIGVVALDGLLYVIGGEDETTNLDAVECYNPKTNTWTMVAPLRNTNQPSGGVVAINRPGFF